MTVKQVPVSVFTTLGYLFGVLCWICSLGFFMVVFSGQTFFIFALHAILTVAFKIAYAVTEKRAIRYTVLVLQALPFFTFAFSVAYYFVSVR